MYDDIFIELSSFVADFVLVENSCTFTDFNPICEASNYNLFLRKLPIKQNPVLRKMPH